jgi:hypothetical protein
MIFFYSGLLGTRNPQTPKVYSNSFLSVLPSASSDSRGPSFGTGTLLARSSDILIFSLPVFKILSETVLQLIFNLSVTFFISVILF